MTNSSTEPGTKGSKLLNPVALDQTITLDGRKIYRSIMTWCPGCNNLHPFRITVFPGCPLRPDGSAEPTWDWNGSLEVPTFSPSLLCYNSVHLCEGLDNLEICNDENMDHCGHKSHIISEDGTRSVFISHGKEPAFGNCHSFLKEGLWQFLSDSAHALAGQTVNMIPIPNWYLH